MVRKERRSRKWIGKAVSLTLCCLMLAGAFSGVVEPTKADDLQPGTKEYYDARWEEAKIKVGNLAAGTAYTNYLGQSVSTAVEGPWMLEDLSGKYRRGEISAPWNGNLSGTKPTVGAGTEALIRFLQQSSCVTVW